MDRIREIVFTQVDKKPKVKKTTVVSRCLCSSIAAFWAHVSLFSLISVFYLIFPFFRCLFVAIYKY